MAHYPLVALVVVPKLGTGHVEKAPVHPPFYGLVFAVSLLKQGHNLGFVRVHIVQPCFRCFGVMLPVHMPVLFNQQVIVKIE